MNPSDNAFKLIKLSEGCKLSAYKDPGSNGLPITCGWGSTMREDGTRFVLGDGLTQSQAEALLAWGVNKRVAVMNHLLEGANLNQNQFDALVSFTYNVGIGNFQSSTLLKKVKGNPNDPLISDEFMKWDKAAGKTLPGLVARRKAESDLYFS